MSNFIDPVDGGSLTVLTYTVSSSSSQFAATCPANTSNVIQIRYILTGKNLQPVPTYAPSAPPPTQPPFLIPGAAAVSALALITNGGIAYPLLAIVTAAYMVFAALLVFLRRQLKKSEASSAAAVVSPENEEKTKMQSYYSVCLSIFSLSCCHSKPTKEEEEAASAVKKEVDEKNKKPYPVQLSLFGTCLSMGLLGSGFVSEILLLFVWLPSKKYYPLGLVVLFGRLAHTIPSSFVIYKILNEKKRNSNTNDIENDGVMDVVDNIDENIREEEKLLNLIETEEMLKNLKPTYALLLFFALFDAPLLRYLPC